MKTNIRHAKVTLVAVIVSPCLSFVLAQPGPRLISAEYQALIEQAPSISPLGIAGAKFNVPADRSALIETQDYLALLTFHDTDVQNRKRYSFRTFHKLTGYEVSGAGEVFENHWRISKPDDSLWNRKDTHVVDKGSKTWVDAGFLKLLWSADRWLYYDPKIATITASDPDTYEKRMKNLKRDASNP